MRTIIFFNYFFFIIILPKFKSIKMFINSYLELLIFKNFIINLLFIYLLLLLIE